MSSPNLAIPKPALDTLDAALKVCGFDTGGPGWGSKSQAALITLADTAETGGLQIVLPSYTGKPVVVLTDRAAADADGSPRAYGANGIGLDYLANAGGPGNWFGIACDPKGKPYVQHAEDPAPGYYVSTTSLVDPHYPESDPRRYVDPETYPGVVLPSALAKQHGAHLGDLVLVERLKAGAKCWGFWYDVGPAVGEVSLYLVKALRGNVDAKHGGIPDQCKFTIYPGSGTGKAMDEDEIAARVAELGLVA